MTASVVVVGGGPAGAAAAITLARLGIKPLVLDAATEPYPKVGECLPPIANPLLGLLGVFDRMEAGVHLRSYGLQCAWAGPGSAERDFLFSSAGLGWHLDRLGFEAELADTAQTAGGEWRQGVNVTGVDRRKGRWSITASTAGGGLYLTTDFLIDATGRRAALARRLGSGRVFLDRLVGVEARLSSDDPDVPVGLFSLIEAVPDGWWYSAPLPGARLSVVFMTDADLPAAAAARTTVGWNSLLKETGQTCRRVANFGACSPPRLRVVTAATSRLVDCTGDGWVAVGDAAATFDPLSSHGIYSALAGGYQAARAIARALAGHSDDLAIYRHTVEETFRRYLALRRNH